MNGDASFNGNLFFGGGSKIDNTGVLTMNTPSNYNSNIVVNSPGKLIMNGDASFNGNLLFGGGSKISNTGFLTMNTGSQFNSNITVNNSAMLISNGDASFNGKVYINASYTNSSNILSDYRMKSNIVHLNNTSFSIDSLNPVFYFNENIKKNDIGFIAHELQEHFPFLVNGEKDGETYQSVNYNGLIGLLVQEIQLLKKKVAQLEQSII